jgi:BlaI family transcriptional regulator, penicillinase repressor
MPKQNSKPTEAELEILSVLWARAEPMTVKEIHEIINAAKPVAYTTILKLLQIMTEKNLVARDAAAKAHVYRAAVERQATERRFAEDLLKRVFQGSAAQLVMRVLESKPTSAEELEQIRQMLDEAERKEK